MNEVMIINLNESDNEFVINKKVSIQNNPLSMLSSFISSSLSTAKQSKYLCLEYLKPAASRTIIGCVDSSGVLELYLLSGFNSNSIESNINYQIHHSQQLKLPDCDSVDSVKCLFYPYRREHGICHFVVILFYGNGNGAVIKCQYIHSSDTLCILNQFEKLNNAPLQCIDAAIYGNVLWIALLNGADNDDYDVFFCDLEHFLN